ncbi:hypothetical protein Micbo1qcDRAFT_209417 [Microdochium bolleyi]|uniref:Uncharacterized protein n=1 Tax=Microdochium bolleyi TaxID=196109 RepID=A0A136IM54_9PEZI|nr:hypothetical protein Micbo1qcDRAFT_209417 [Microdochium bolleyi]
MTRLFLAAKEPATPRKEPLSFLDLPGEVRNQVYDIYMLNHIAWAADSAAHPAPQNASNRITFESTEADTPALLGTCQQVFMELKPLAAEYLRFVVNGSRRRLDRRTALLTSRSKLSLPTRCKSELSALRHVEIEWRVDELGSQQGYSGSWGRLALALNDIDMLLRDPGRGGWMWYGRIETLRLTLRTAAGLTVRAEENPWREAREFPEEDMTRMVNLRLHCPWLRTVEFVGTFKKEWLDVTEKRLAHFNIKILRGRPSGKSSIYERHCTEVHQPAIASLLLQALIITVIRHHIANASASTFGVFRSRTTSAGNTMDPVQSHVEAASSARPSPTFLKIPAEIRLLICELYKLNYIRSASQESLISSSAHDYSDTPYGHSKIFFEKPTNESPSLLRVCKLVSREFQPTISQHLRFVFCEEEWQEQARPRRSSYLPLPARCRDMSRVRPHASAVGFEVCK